MKIHSQLNSNRVLFSLSVLGSLSPFIFLIELLSHDEIEVFFYHLCNMYSEQKLNPWHGKNTPKRQSEWNVFFGSWATKCGEPPRSSHSRRVESPQLWRQVSYTKAVSKRCFKSIHSFLWSSECVCLDAGGGVLPKLPVRGGSARKGYLNFQASVYMKRKGFH